VLSLPIAYRTEPVGRLVLDRRDRSQLTQDDQRLLGDLVRQAAAAARATDINAALRRARTGLVLAREDERRRLRRDLHDGLGPSLGAIALRIETARNLAGAAPDAADRMLDGAARDIGAVLDEVRRVVYDLRPPALDELGLVRAVRQQADRLAGATRSIQVHAVEPLPALPAAVEVAAYRIVSEALTNVVRHADATRCTVTLIPDPGDVALVVEIRDDGRGWEPDTAAGVGLISMRERAAELGGWCDIIRPENGGTAVRCRLPFTGNQPAEWFNDDVTTEAHV
jgi:signal transduction histidine kinase